jgi:hypothetical protein
MLGKAQQRLQKLFLQPLDPGALRMQIHVSKTMIWPTRKRSREWAGGQKND